MNKWAIIAAALLWPISAGAFSISPASPVTQCSVVDSTGYGSTNGTHWLSLTNTLDNPCGNASAWSNANLANGTHTIADYMGSVGGDLTTLPFTQTIHYWLCDYNASPPYAAEDLGSLDSNITGTTCEAGPATPAGGWTTISAIIMVWVGFWVMVWIIWMLGTFARKIMQG